MKLNYITLAVFAVAVVVFAARASQMPWTPAHIAGLVILVPSFVLFVMSRLQLGRSFSVEAKATALVTTGIYSRIRNPIYVFGALMIAGVVVWSGRPVFFLIFLFLIPMQVMRARKEEQVLQKTFGDAYTEYKRKTWF
jgi:protein-S-isoprenylcysteine O-methyltransferase Ste14